MSEQLRARMIAQRQRQNRRTALGAGISMNPMLALRPSAGIIHAPLAPCLHTNLERFIIHQEDANKVGGTAKAIDPKQLEWYTYCELKYPNSQNKYHLNYDKIYPFMFYQAFREQRPRGKKNNLEPFNVEEYDTMMAGFAGQQLAEGTLVNPPVPQKPCGIRTFEQYKYMFKGLHKQAVAERTTSLVWEHIWQNGLTSLAKHVKTRAPTLKRLNFEEKHNGEFAPYAIAEKHNEIEDHMWDDSAKANGRRSVCTQLRHRYCFGHLTAGLLRCETLYSAELSDFIGILPPKKETDIHTPYVMINQIALGKTNHGRVLFGRATRHKDVRLCCVGACGFYLQCRFDITHEFEDFTVEDWMDNSKWFDIKLLTDVCGDNKQAIQNDSYGEHITLVLNNLGLPNNKKLHLGRNVGTKKLDLCEISPEEIKRMGNWNPSIYDSSYSSKVPMVAIRSMAGFSGNHKFYCVPRTAVEPPQSLLDKTPIGKWCYKAKDELKEADPEGKKITANYVLKFFCELNKVSVQDAAAMAVLHEGRDKHPIYEDIEAFKCKEFEEYKKTMERALNTATDPLDANLESVLPGVQQWHSATNQSLESHNNRLDGLNEEVTTLKEAVQDGFKALRSENREIAKKNASSMASAFLAMAEKLIAGSGRGDNFRDLDTELVSDIMDLEDEVQDNHTDSPTATTTDPTSPVPVTPPELAPKNLNSNVSTGEIEEASRFVMRHKHSCLMDLWNEWHGTGNFTDQYGGIEGRNKLFGKAWRKHCKKGAQQQYSRTSRVVEAIWNHIVKYRVPELDAVVCFEEVFACCGGSVACMVKKFQGMNLLKKRKPRGRKSQK